MSLRLRLTLAFSLSMAAVIAGFGAFLYLRLGAELLRKIDLELRSRGDVILTALSERRPVPVGVGSRVIDPDEAFAQVLEPSGRIVDTSPAVAAAPMLEPATLRQVSGPTFLTRRVEGVDDPARLLAVSTRDAGGRVVVVGATLGDRGEALGRLLLLLALGGPVALMLSSAAGWAVAGVALRPVERIRREAAAISEAEPDRRLPVPATGDELARLARTLNEMLARLQEAHEREHRFVDDASHELRTPLAVLKAELDLALARPRSLQELEQVVRSASIETDRLVRLAQDLLVLARTGRGRLPLAPARVDLRELLVEAAAPFVARARDGGGEIEVSACDGEVWLDPVRIRQAVENLLDNAVRHTGGPYPASGAGGPYPASGAGGPGPVRVSVERVDGEVRIVVDDAGPGFPANVVDRAFEPFSRGSPSGPDSGAGLGLAIVKAVAEAHGGHVRASTGERGGARVVIAIPAPARGPEDGPTRPGSD